MSTIVYGVLPCGHNTIIADTGGHSCNNMTLREDQAANARCIAALPELLEAAEYAVPLLDELLNQHENPILDALRTAINKATPSR